MGFLPAFFFGAPPNDNPPPPGENKKPGIHGQKNIDKFNPYEMLLKFRILRCSIQIIKARLFFESAIKKCGNV